MRNSLSTTFEPDTEIVPLLKIFNNFIPSILNEFLGVSHKFPVNPVVLGLPVGGRLDGAVIETVNDGTRTGHQDRGVGSDDKLGVTGSPHLF